MVFKFGFFKEDVNNNANAGTYFHDINNFAHKHSTAYAAGLVGIETTHPAEQIKLAQQEINQAQQSITKTSQRLSSH